MDFGWNNPVKKETTQSSIPIINVVRSFSIFKVLAGHIGTNCNPPDLPWLANLWGSFQGNALHGVDLFFVVSGFLITRAIRERSGNLFRPDIRDFYARRVGRIFPLLIFTLLFGVWMLYFSKDHTPLHTYCFNSHRFPFSGFFWISILTFTFNLYWLKLEPISDYGFGLHWNVLWSLSIEEQFYFFYPWVLKWFKSRKKFIYFLVLLIVAGVLSRFFSALFLKPGCHWEAINSLAGFDFISIGILLFITQEKFGLMLKKNKTISRGICIFGLVVVLTVDLTTNPNSDEGIYAPTLLGMGAYLFLLGGLNLGSLSAFWVDWLGFPGRLSYGIYLLHSGIFYFIWPVLAGQNSLVAFLVLSTTSTGVCFLSYRFFELPSNHLIRRFISKKSSVTT